MCVEPSISDKIRGDKTTDTHVIVIPERSRRMGHTAITYLYIYAPGQLSHSLCFGYVLFTDVTTLQIRNTTPRPTSTLKQVIPVIFKVTGQETA